MRRLGFALALFASGCLTEDTRPPPATVLFTLASAPETIDGVTTSDGWRVTFDRVLVSIGRPGIGGDNCNAYDEADYFRLLDGQSKSPQKIAIVFGLSSCTLSYRVRNPDAETLLGTGVSEADRYLMRTAADDPYTKGFGVSILVRGHASKGTSNKSFSWALRRNRVRYESCNTTTDDPKAPPTTLELTADDAPTIELRVHAETVLHDRLTPSLATMRFDPIAHADDAGDRDGVVTLEELEAVPLADVGVDTSILGNEVESASSWKSLGNLVYDGLLPRVVRPSDAGRCVTSFQQRED